MLRVLILPVALFLLAGLIVGLVNAQSDPAPDAERTNRLTCAGMGFQNGYLDGWAIGLRDARYRGATDIERHPLYQQAERGFHEAWLYRVVYQNAYRQGLARGYEDGLAGRANQVVERFDELEPVLAGPAPATPSPARPAGRDDLQVPAGTRVLFVLTERLSTAMNQRGDPFSGEVARDVFIGDQLAIPRGAVVQGTVGQVVRPGRVSGRAEMTLRFDRVVFSGGEQETLSATLSGVGGDGRLKDEEGTYEGRGSQGRDAAIIGGGAGAGAIIGGIAGGGRGAGIGAALGGLVGLAGVLSTRGEDIDLGRGTLIEITIDRDLHFAPRRPR